MERIKNLNICLDLMKLNEEIDFTLKNQRNSFEIEETKIRVEDGYIYNLLKKEYHQHHQEKKELIIEMEKDFIFVHYIKLEKIENINSLDNRENSCKYSWNQKDIIGNFYFINNQGTLCFGIKNQSGIDNSLDKKSLPIELIETLEDIKEEDITIHYFNPEIFDFDKKKKELKF